jgi:sarcosine oxidase subunit gamma
MVDALLPVPGGAASYPGVTIAVTGAQTRFSLRTRDGAGLPSILSSADFAGGTALGLGPDEWLLLLPDGARAPALAGTHALTDVSHRNIGFTVEGPSAEALLQTGCPLDLSLAAFPVGKVTRTLYETVEIVLWRQAEGFRVEAWRSFTPWLWEALTLAAGDLDPA